MTGRQPPMVFKIFWKFISPGAIIIMLALSLYTMFTESPQYLAWNTKEVSRLIQGRSS